MREVEETEEFRLHQQGGDWRSDASDRGIRVLGLEESEGIQTIFLDDPSFNFDYAHILPQTQKCSVMHGHTSSALVEIVGAPSRRDGRRLRGREGDHQGRDRSWGPQALHQQEVRREGGRQSVTLKFKTVHGDFTIEAPKATTVLLEGEATVENLAREVVSRIRPGCRRTCPPSGSTCTKG